jgi:hypothetical protein
MPPEAEGLNPIEDRTAFEKAIDLPGLAAFVIAGDDDASRQFVEWVLQLRGRVDDVRWHRLADLEVARMFGVEEAPGLVLFREGVGLYAERFTAGKAALEPLLRQAASLDMGPVHREIEQRRAAETALATHLVCPTARRGPLPS